MLAAGKIDPKSREVRVELEKIKKKMTENKKKAKAEPASSSSPHFVSGAPPRPRLKGTRVGRPMAAGRRDFGLKLPSSASRDAYRNAVGAFPGMAAHRRVCPFEGFELVGVQTAEERSEANRQRAEQEGNVLEIDDDSSAVAQAEPPSQPGKGEDSEVIEID